MERLYAPFREDYFKKQESSECVFCDIATNPLNDEENKVVHRIKDIFVVMNKYPYSPGHILIVPNMHVDSPYKLSRDIWLEMFDLSHKFVNVLNDYGASGINIGMNIKQAAGAGIPNHLHLHMLPRWSGDTNFFTTIGDCRAYGVDFDKVYERICEISKRYL